MRIKELYNTSSGFSFKSQEFSSEGIPLIRIGDLRDNVITIDDKTAFLPENYARKYSKFVLKENDILIAMSGATIGKFAIFENDSPAILNQRVAVFRNIENSTLMQRYLFYYLFTANQHIRTLATSSAIENITLSELQNLEIYIPENKINIERIVSILDRNHYLIKKRQQTIEILDQLVKSVFLDMFENQLKDKKYQRSLGDYIKKGPQNGIYKHDEFYGEGTKIVRIDSFYDGILNTDNYKLIKLTVDEKEKYLLQQNDILINRVNSKKFLGKSAIVKSSIENAVFESNIMRFSVNEERLDPFFLIYSLQLNYIKKQILQKSKDAINQSSINQIDVKSLMLPLPNIELQKYFSNIYQIILSIKEKLNTNLIELNHLFQSFLQKAFKGELEFEKEKILEDILPNLKIEELLSDIKLLKSLLDKLQKQNFKTGSNYKLAQNLLFQLLDNKKSGVFQQCDVETENVEIKHEAS